jgi:hypothetical protein
MATRLPCSSPNDGDPCSRARPTSWRQPTARLSNTPTRTSSATVSCVNAKAFRSDARANVGSSRAFAVATEVLIWADNAPQRSAKCAAQIEDLFVSGGAPPGPRLRSGWFGAYQEQAGM